LEVDLAEEIESELAAARVRNERAMASILANESALAGAQKCGAANLDAEPEGLLDATSEERALAEVQDGETHEAALQADRAPEVETASEAARAGQKRPLCAVRLGEDEARVAAGALEQTALEEVYQSDLDERAQELRREIACAVAAAQREGREAVQKAADALAEQLPAEAASALEEMRSTLAAQHAERMAALEAELAEQRAKVLAEVAEECAQMLVCERAEVQALVGKAAIAKGHTMHIEAERQLAAQEQQLRRADGAALEHAVRVLREECRADARSCRAALQDGAHDAARRSAALAVQRAEAAFAEAAHAHASEARAETRGASELAIAGLRAEWQGLIAGVRATAGEIHARCTYLEGVNLALRKQMASYLAPQTPRRAAADARPPLHLGTAQRTPVGPKAGGALRSEAIDGTPWRQADRSADLSARVTLLGDSAAGGEPLLVTAGRSSFGETPLRSEDRVRVLDDDFGGQFETAAADPTVRYKGWPDTSGSSISPVSTPAGAGSGAIARTPTRANRPQAWRQTHAASVSWPRAEGDRLLASLLREGATSARSSPSANSSSSARWSPRAAGGARRNLAGAFAAAAGRTDS